MSGVSFQVELGALRSHAGRVDEVASAVGQAVGAAETTLDSKAFGVMCQFLPPVVSSSQTQTVDCVRGLAETLTKTASEVRDMANTFEDADTTARQSYDRTRQQNTSRLAGRHLE